MVMFIVHLGPRLLLQVDCKGLPVPKNTESRGFVTLLGIVSLIELGCLGLFVV